MSHSSHLNMYELDGAASDSDERSPLSRRSSVEDLSYGQCVEAPNRTTSQQGVTAGPVVSPGSHQDATQAMDNTTSTQDAGSSFTHNSIPPQQQENAENAQEDRVPPQQQENPRRQGRNNGPVIQVVQHSNGTVNASIVSGRGRHIIVSTDSGGSTTISMGGGQTFTTHSSGSHSFSTHNHAFSGSQSGAGSFSTGPTFTNISNHTVDVQFSPSVSNNGVHTFSSQSVHSRPRHNLNPGSSRQLGLPTRPRLAIGPGTAPQTTTRPTSGSGNVPSSSSADTSRSVPDSDVPDFTVSTDLADVRAAAQRFYGGNVNIYGGRYMKINKSGTYVHDEVNGLRRVN